MTSMALVFGILLFTASVVTSFVPPEIESACRKEVAFDGDIHTLDFNSPSFSNEAKCFLACVMQKEKIMKEDETIDKAAAKEFFEKVIKEEELKMKIIKAVDECNAEVKANKCETAFEFAKCKKAKVLAMTPETIIACNKETGFDGDPMKLDFNSPSFPNDAKCFVACTMQKDKVMKDDGTIDKAAAKELYDRLIEDSEVKKSLMNVLDECEAEGFLAVKTNKCETAFEFSRCNRDKAAMKFGSG